MNNGAYYSHPRDSTADHASDRYGLYCYPEPVPGTASGRQSNISSSPRYQRLFYCSSCSKLVFCKVPTRALQSIFFQYCDSLTHKLNYMLPLIMHSSDLQPRIPSRFDSSHCVWWARSSTHQDRHHIWNGTHSKVCTGSSRKK